MLLLKNKGNKLKGVNYWMLPALTSMQAVLCPGVFSQSAAKNIQLNQAGFYPHAPKLALITNLFSSNNFNIISHHTVLQYNKKKYIIYHLIANASTEAKDLLREICIDELSFDKKGNINIVKPAPGIKNFIKWSQ